MKRKNDQFLSRYANSIKRVSDASSPRQRKEGFLGMVVDAAPVITPNTIFRWEYDVEAIFVTATAPYDPVVKTNVPTYKALSISELGNHNAVYSYGVPDNHLIGGFEPVRIPDGTPVYCVPARKDDGTFFWLIINTQAITGLCTPVNFVPDEPLEE